MHDELNEKLSRFIDDDLETQQLRELERQLKQDPSLKQKLNRYQIVSELLKAPEAVIIKSNFSEQIRQQIEAEPTYLLPVPKTEKFKHKTRFALAASIAVALVIVPGFIKQSTHQSNSNQLVVQQRINFEPQGFERPRYESQSAQLVRMQKYPVNPRFKDYLQAHSNSVYTIGSSNYQPYARVAGYGEENQR